MPSIAKKNLSRRKWRKLSLSSFEKTKPNQTSGSLLAERIKRTKTTKHEMELIKFVDCFLDGSGSYKNNWVTFENGFW